MAKLKISNKEITNFIKPVPLRPIGIKRKPLSPRCSGRFTFRPSSKNFHRILSKRGDIRDMFFPSYSRKAWKEGPRQGRYCANLFFNPPFEREEECVQGACGIEWIGFFDFHPPPRISLLGQTICYGGWSIEGLVIRLVAPVEDWG